MPLRSPIFIYNLKSTRMRKNDLKASRMQSRIRLLSILFALFFVFALPATAKVLDGVIHVTIVNSDISVREALDEVKKQVGGALMYQSDIINDKIRLNLNLKNVPINKALTSICTPAGLQFELENGYILIVKAKERPKGTPKKKIKGIVIDQTGEPLMGVTVTIDGERGKGTITDENGRYELEAFPTDLMVFSYIGMEKQYVTPRSDTEVNVVMEENAKMLNDVVVTGFQTISKERATGAFDIIKQATLDKPSTTIADRLVGRVAGVQATTTADGDISFTIRGQGTLQSNEEPLIVVDGFPISTGFASINPNDVESISILKDAAAASIWGARASNGVIVVTTKKGKKGKGLTVEVDAQLRIGSKTDIDYLRNMLSGNELIEYQKNTFGTYATSMEFTPVSNPASTSDFRHAYDAHYTQAGVLYNKYKNLKEISESEYNAGLSALAQLNNKKQIEDELLKRPVYQQYNITMSGGTDRMNNYVSLLYGYDTSRYQGSNSQNFQFDYRGQMHILKWLDMNVSATARYKKDNQSGITSSDIATMAPYDMIVNTDGSYTDMSHLMYYKDGVNTILDRFDFPYHDWSYNIAQEVNGRDITNKTLNGRFQIGLKATIIEGLTVDTKFQLEHVQQDTRSLQSDDTYYVRNLVNMFTTLDWRTNNATANISKGSILNESKLVTDSYNWRNQINFARTFAERHAINFVGGIEISQSKNNPRTYAPVYGYDDEYLTSYPIQNVRVKGCFDEYVPQSIIDTKSSFITYAVERYFSAFANLSYTFDDKYSISGSYRTDASNFIADDPKYRYSPFWSVGLSWNMMNENFMKSLHWIDYLRPRITYGCNGNANTTTSPVPLIAMKGLTTFTYEPYAIFTAFGNPTMGWERTHIVNIGFDWSFFNSKFYGKFDFYNKKGTDILADISIPIASGQFKTEFNTTDARITANAAEVTNRGFELELGTDQRFGKDFRWSGNITMAYNKNKVDKLFRNYISHSNMLNPTAIEGHDIYGLWAYEYTGITKSADGSYNVPTILTNREENITSRIDNIPEKTDGRKAMKYMGTTVAPWTIGMNHSFGYKEWDLSFTFIGKFGHKFRQTGFNYADPLNTIPNRQYSQLKESNVMPMPDNKTVLLYHYSNLAPYMDYNVKNANHVRLQELTLAYSLPNRLLNKWGISRLTCYLQSNNLFTIKAAEEDPEYAYSSFRLQPAYTIGVKFAY